MLGVSSLAGSIRAGGGTRQLGREVGGRDGEGEGIWVMDGGKCEGWDTMGREEYERRGGEVKETGMMEEARGGGGRREGREVGRGAG